MIDKEIIMKCSSCGGEIADNKCSYCGTRKDAVPEEKSMPIKKITVKVSGSMNDLHIKYANKIFNGNYKLSGSMNNKTIYLKNPIHIRVSGSMNNVSVDQRIEYTSKETGSMNDIITIGGQEE